MNQRPERVRCQSARHTTIRYYFSAPLARRQPACLPGRDSTFLSQRVSNQLRAQALCDFRKWNHLGMDWDMCFVLSVFVRRPHQVSRNLTTRDSNNSYLLSGLFSISKFFLRNAKLICFTWFGSVKNRSLLGNIATNSHIL
jgi:hypothetical protein